MAEAVVSVLGKLAIVIANEAQYLGGVRKKVERVQRELTRIKCCLQDADSRHKGDERVQNWLNELRDAAYRIKDATDTFFFHVGYTDSRFSQKLKRLCNRPRELYFLHKLGTKLDDIQIYSKRSLRAGLETLELRGHGYENFDGLWTISTLRHVLVDYGGNIHGSIPKGTLISNLQTLKWFQLNRGEAICDVKLPNLRKLGIQHRSDEWVSITNLLQTLPLLVSLKIDGDLHSLPKEIVYPKALPNYQNLQSLHLDRKWSENVNVDARLLPPHLVKLTLYQTYLNHNPMPELEKLNGLKKLCLSGFLIENWEGPINCPEGFPALQFLQVDDPDIKDLTVEEEFMPNLTYLQVNSNTEVHLPLKLQHMRVERKW